MNEAEKTWCGHFAADKVMDGITVTMTLGELRRHIAAGIDGEKAKCDKCKEWEREVMSLKCRLADAQAKAVAPGSIVFTPDGFRQVKKGEWYDFRGTLVNCTTYTTDTFQVYKRRVV